ncbi:hypothetical protein RWE15_02030 [Virgibacillus halophilus]|uniref:Uncharacterized protein n=1 Tax=Tigheibacillus halophilus TaxID=361280 RepID=A0ABU5C296_9BACI|nr:hypothetical protein [Virgibacillus halophilus]
MKKLPLIMLYDLQNLTDYPLPAGYHFRYFDHHDDKKICAEIVIATNEFPTEQAALQRFDSEFSPHLPEAKHHFHYNDR